MAQSDVKSTQGMAILTFGAFGPVLPCITVVVLVLIWCFAFLLFSTDGIEMGICISLQVCRAFWLAVTSRSIPQAGSSQPIELWVVPTHRTPGRPNPSMAGSGAGGRTIAKLCELPNIVTIHTLTSTVDYFTNTTAVQLLTQLLHIPLRMLIESNWRSTIGTELSIGSYDYMSLG